MIKSGFSIQAKTLFLQDRERGCSRVNLNGAGWPKIHPVCRISVAEVVKRWDSLGLRLLSLSARSMM